MPRDIPCRLDMDSDIRAYTIWILTSIDLDIRSYMVLILIQGGLAFVLILLSYLVLFGMGNQMDNQLPEVSGLLYILDKAIPPEQGVREDWKQHLFVLHGDDVLSCFVWPSETDLQKQQILKRAHQHQNQHQHQLRLHVRMEQDGEAGKEQEEEEQVKRIEKQVRQCVRVCGLFACI